MSTPDIQLEALHTLLSFLVVVFVVNGFTPQTKLYQFVQTRADNWLSGNCVWLTTAWVQSLFLAAIDKKYHQVGEKRFDRWKILSPTIKMKVINEFTPQTLLYQFVQTCRDNWLSEYCVWLTTAQHGFSSFFWSNWQKTSSNRREKIWSLGNLDPYNQKWKL